MYVYGNLRLLCPRKLIVCYKLQVQIIGYNTDLYHNFTEALLSTHGLAVLAILGSVRFTE